jgi:hypothetical protein
VAEIKRAMDRGVPTGVVLADAGYGNDFTVRTTFRRSAFLPNSSSPRLYTRRVIGEETLSSTSASSLNEASLIDGDAARRVHSSGGRHAGAVRIPATVQMPA